MSERSSGEQHGVPSGAEPELQKLVREAGRPSPRSFWLGLVLGVLLVVAATLLVVQNGQSTSVTWIAFHFSAPLWLLLLVSMLAGVLLGLLAPLLRRLRRTRAARRRSAREQLDQMGKARG